MSRVATVAVQRVDSVDRRKAFRLEIAKHDVPQTLALAALILAGFSAAGWLIGRDSFALHAGDIALAPLLFIASRVARRPSVRPAAVPWIWAMSMALVVVVLLLEILDDRHSQDFIYVIMAITAFGSATMAWRPFWTAGAIMMAATVIVTASWPDSEMFDWLLGAMAALACSAGLLRVRMRSVADTADATSLAERLASTDPLTGLLNRHGLESLFPNVAAASMRHRLPVNVAFIDIDGLKEANDRFGHRFGDDVIRQVASSVRTSMREGDLVARWGGDEIVVVGIGLEWQADKLHARIESALRRSVIELLKWPGRISLGTATAKSRDVDLDALIRAADENMYERRNAAREPVKPRQFAWREGAA